MLSPWLINEVSTSSAHGGSEDKAKEVAARIVPTAPDTSISPTAGGQHILIRLGPSEQRLSFVINVAPNSRSERVRLANAIIGEEDVLTVVNSRSR